MGTAQTSVQHLGPEFQELQHIVSSQTNRLSMLQDQLSSQQLSHALEIQRIQSQHVMEMEQVRRGGGGEEGGGSGVQSNLTSLFVAAAETPCRANGPV